MCSCHLSILLPLRIYSYHFFLILINSFTDVIIFRILELVILGKKKSLPPRVLSPSLLPALSHFPFPPSPSRNVPLLYSLNALVKTSSIAQAYTPVLTHASLPKNTHTRSFLLTFTSSSFTFVIK